MKVLIDEMHEGLDEQLAKSGFEAYSTRKLCELGKKLHSDYSIMKYTEKYKMVLITEDVDNIDGCIENDMKYVKYGQEDPLQYLIESLNKIKNELI